MKKSAGFTLIELLVVISIIAVLSTVGFVSFQNVRKNALDAKIRADLDAIKKAYETNYDPAASGGQGGYKELTDNMFAGGKIPTQSDGSPYNCAAGPGCGILTDQGYKVSAVLSDGTTVYAVTSTGGTLADKMTSCDPTDTLKNGLVGYWKFDEGEGNSTRDWSDNHTAGSFTGNPVWQSGSDCIAGTCLKFPDQAGISIPITSASPLNLGTSDFTVTVWVTIPATSGQNGTGIFGRYPHTTLYNGNFVIRIGDLLNEQNKLRFTYRDSTRFINTPGYDYSAHWGVRTFITYVKSGDNLYLYINGGSPKQTVDISSWNLNVNFYGNNSLYFISYTGWSPGNWPNIIIDEHQVYNRPLSENEVKLLYNSGSGCF